MAQLGARLNGIQKVSGSIPLGSTRVERRPGEIVAPGLLRCRAANCGTTSNLLSFGFKNTVGSSGSQSVVIKVP